MNEDKVEDIIITIENDVKWFINTKDLPSTNEGLSAFLRRTSEARLRNKCKELSFAENAYVIFAYVIFVLWEKQGRDTKVLRDRASYNKGSTLAPFWEKMYKEAQTEWNPLANITDAQQLMVKLNTPLQQEKKEMNPTTAFETKHFVYGVDVTTMNDNQLIDAIRKVEGEINSLSGIQTKSTAITKKIENLQSMLASIVHELDSRT